MRTMNPALEEASSASGARPARRPSSASPCRCCGPGVLAPLILATLVALEQFEMPLIIGFPARINVFSTRLYFDLNPEDELPAYGKAAAVALLFLAAAILLLLVYNHLIRRAERFVTVTGKGYRPTRYRARPLARAGAAVRRRSICAVAAILPADRAGLDELLRRRQRRHAASTPTGPCSPTGASGRRCATPSWSRACSAGIVTLIGALLAWQILRAALPRPRGCSMS